MKLQKLGIQLFTVRDHMNTAEQIRETFRNLKSMGYDQAQTAGCAIPYEEYGRIAREEGIEIVGTHDDWNMMVNDVEQAVKNHQLLGTHFMGTGGTADTCFDTVEALETYCEQCNKIGAAIAPYGMKFTYHNHMKEFRRLKGKHAMDIMMEAMDPATTSFCFDTCWAHASGCDECEWIEKLAGRIDIIHLKDWGLWKNYDTKVMEIGRGNLNWKRIIETAEKTGVKYYVVEQDDWEGEAMDSANISSQYLHRNFMV